MQNGSALGAGAGHHATEHRKRLPHVKERALLGSHTIDMASRSSSDFLCKAWIHGERRDQRAGFPEPLSRFEAECRRSFPRVGRIGGTSRRLTCRNILLAASGRAGRRISAPPSFSQRLIAFAFSSASVRGLRVLRFMLRTLAQLREFFHARARAFSSIADSRLRAKSRARRNLTSPPNNIHWKHHA